MATYDTDKPLIVGNSFSPLIEQSTVVDTGAEVGYRFVATEDALSSLSSASWLSVVTAEPPPGVPDRSEIVCRMYHNDPLDACTPLQRVVITCTAGSGGTIGGGAATREAAVANPSEPTYVRLTGASQSALFWFNTDDSDIGELFNTWDTEIVDVSVVYTVVGPFSTATTNTMSCGLERQVGPIRRYMDYLVTGPSSSSSVTTTKQSRFGELNPFWDTGLDPNSEPMRAPWVYQGANDTGLYALSGNSPSGDDVAVFFETGSSADGDFDIVFVALQVTYRNNYNLIGIGGIDLSGGAEIHEGLYTYRCPIMVATDPWDYTGASGSTIGMVIGDVYTITVSRAYSGSVSLASAVPVQLSLLNTITDTTRNLTGVRITKPMAIGSVPSLTETTEFPAIVIYAFFPTYWETRMTPAYVNSGCHAYMKQIVHVIHDSGYFYSEQEIADDTEGTFTTATFYARAAEAVTGPLIVSQTDGSTTFLGPEGSIDYDTWAALPEIVDGWRRVTVALSPAAELAGAGGVTHWRFWTSSSELAVWEVLGATANNTTKATGVSSGAVSGYQGETATASYRGTADYPLDMTLTLAQDMTPVQSSTTTYLRGSGTASHADNASVTPGLPTGWQAGDLLVMVAAIREGTAYPDTPLDWTILRDAANVVVFGKVATAGEVAPTVTFTGGSAGDSCSAQIAGVVGAYATVLAADSQDNVSAQDVDTPELSVGSNGPALLLWVAWKADDATGTTSGPGAEAFASWTTLGDDQYISLRYFLTAESVDTVDADTFVIAGGGAEVSVGVTIAVEVNPVLTATLMTQALSVVDEYCGVDTSGIPTGIVYTMLSWDQVYSEMTAGWGAYEIQRRDTTMDADVWETIANITNPHIGEFSDYEQRIGVTSSYRMRTVHTTGAVGPWSVVVTSTVAAPGVTGTGCDVGTIVLTTNEDPSANLAYVQVWGTPEETFDFPEAGYGSLEFVYGRDYSLSLRPTERGGTTFTRTLMVNRAGIPTGTMDRGFTGLRDLAWDSVPYVCVRDELSNRWLTNVSVPSGTVRRLDGRATHYQLSAVTFTEVTGDPYAHDDPVPFLGLESTSHFERYADISSCALLATVEDVDVRVKLILLDPLVGWGFFVSRYDVGPPESWWGCGLWKSYGSSAYFEVLGDDGTYYEDIDTIVPIVGQPMWVRFLYDHDDGLGGSTATFYTSLNGVDWTSFGTITAGPAGLVPSGEGEFYIYPLVGTVVQEMIVIDSGTSTTIMSPNFAEQDADTEQFTDSQANTWTIKVW